MVLLLRTKEIPRVCQEQDMGVQCEPTERLDYVLSQALFACRLSVICHDF